MAFGAEFCHRHLSPPEDVFQAAAHCRRLGIGFSLVTPLLREGALDPVTAWLDRVARGIGETEWIVNDWRLLAWGRERGLPLRPVAGRLLGRQRRGPRALELARSAPPEQAGSLRSSAWEDRRTVSLLEEFGVSRVELDSLPQGVRRPSLAAGISLSLCGPWIPMSVAPSCPWSADPFECTQTCREHPAVVQQAREGPHALWSRGNTLFVRSDANPPVVVAAYLGADRLVWAEEIPG